MIHAIADTHVLIRIIAATALHYDAPLISRDRKIELDNVETVW